MAAPSPRRGAAQSRGDLRRLDVTGWGSAAPSTHRDAISSPTGTPTPSGSRAPMTPRRSTMRAAWASSRHWTACRGATWCRGHRCVARRLASRCGRCRRQDRRRRRHPYRNPAGFLRRGGRARRRQGAVRAYRGRAWCFCRRPISRAQERCRQIVESEILDLGYAIYGWRQVPINVACIGEKANATRPEIEQIMIRNAAAQARRISSATFM